MLVNPNNRIVTERLPSASRTSATGLSADTPSFESQLSSALAESLQKLGVGGGEVNITIKNPSATTRQIVVTYSVDGTAGTPAAPPAGTTSEKGPADASSAPAPNPFNLALTYIAPAPVKEESATPWAPAVGPKDSRDQAPEGGGKVTASGAPSIVDNLTAAGNQHGYTGPAAKNPYFSTPSNPLREGYVLGFNKWFENPKIHGGPNGPQDADKKQYATEEGAKEALRIVQLFAPEATIVKSVWQSGPYGIDTPQYEIELGDGRRLNAGGVLSAYYTHGYGVTASADETIRRSIQLA